MEKQEAIEKVKKLLRLAEHNPNKAESESAAAKAQSIMDEHNLSIATVNALTGREQEPIYRFESSPLNEGNNGTKSTWKQRLGSALARLNGCEMYLKGPNFILVGKPSNVETVRYLYAYCEKQIDALVKANCKGQGRIYANNYRIGCIDGIKSAIEAERKANFDRLRKEAVTIQRCAPESKELMVLNNAIANIERNDYEAVKTYLKANGFRYQSYYSSASYDPGARSAGASAGRSLYGSRRAIGGSQKRIN